MNYINNFRYGEISRKNAGRFDTEYYGQGAFRFLNMQTGILGEAMRRPPLKEDPVTNIPKEIDFDLLDIRECTISDEFSYLVGLGKKQIYLFGKVAGQMKLLWYAVYPNYGEGEDEKTSIQLTDKTVHEVRTCQYFNRMYFAHHTFRTFYIDITPGITTDVELSPIKLLLNQYGKQQYHFTPSYIEDADGKELPNQESRLVYYDKNTQSWYFDKEFSEDKQYKYASKYPPLKGEKAYIQNYDDPKDDTLMTGRGNYPSEINIINDCIYFAATDREPHTIWKSRVLGSSQYIEGYTPDSMHDFITFQSVITESRDIIAAENLPKKEMRDSNNNIVYENDNSGRAIYYTNDNVNGVYTYDQQLYWKVDTITVFYEDSEFTIPYSGSKTPIQEGDGLWYGENVDGSRIQVYPHQEDGKLYFKDKEMTVRYNGVVIQKPLLVYDLSDPNKLMKTVCRVDFVTTDSCGDKLEFNNGRQDKIMFIRPACGKIIIGTTNGEEVLPAGFSPVSNRTKEHYSDYGSFPRYNIAPVSLNSSFFFLQKANVVREFYLYQGFMNRNDATFLNHDILNGDVVEMISKNVPTPTVYFLMSDGTMRILVYDKELGIQSFSRWETSGKIRSISKLEENGRIIVYAMVERENKDGTTYNSIAYFDENNKVSYKDFSDAEGNGDIYISEIETPYAEIIDNQFIGFGNFKKANKAYVRCYNTGRIKVGDDREQLTESSERIGNEDYPYTLIGASSRQYSVIIQSIEDEPMNILAFGYEIVKR